MKCPLCQAPTEVLETRHYKSKTTVKRRYQCFNLHRFTTLESIVSTAATTEPHSAKKSSQFKTAGSRTVSPDTQR